MTDLQESALVAWAFAIAIIAVPFALCGVRRLRAFIWSGGLPARLGALPVDEVEADEAPRGWKCAQLLVSPDGTQVRLAGVAIGGAYLAEDTAVCVAGRNHVPPALSCECGFYAFFDRTEAAKLLARRLGYDGQVIVRALCEVDLAGTVVVCDRGYRAERQRVLQVGLLPWCADCAGEGRLVRAQLLGAGGQSVQIPEVPAWGRARDSDRPLQPSVRLLREWPALRPLCLSCAELLGEGAVAITPLEVRGRLQTEVRWLDAGMVSTERVLAAHRPRPPLGF